MSDQEPDSRSTATRSPRFVSALVHELRSPLSTLLMLADLLAENRSGHLDEQELGWATGLRAAAIDVRGLLEQIARLARIEGGRVEARFARVAVAELLGELREQLREHAQERGTTLRWTLDPQTPTHCTTDPSLLRELLALLLEAALAASAGAPVELAVARSAAAGAGPAGTPGATEEIVFRVTDRGPAVPAARELLAPFGSPDPRNRRRFGGAGLGLSIARALARLLLGELVVEASEKPAEGVVLVLRLPIEVPVDVLTGD